MKPVTHSAAPAQGAAAPPSPAQRACTPLRAGYASDLRDEALAANNLTAVLYQQKVGFTQNPPPARVRKLGLICVG